MKKREIIVPILILLCLTVGGQNEVDALRYSQTTFGGTARYMGLAGAFGAVGADLSVIGSNPAGIGIFKTSEIVFTPSVYNSGTSTSYYGSENSDYMNNFNISSVGFIYTSDVSGKNQEGKWHNVQFGFSLIRNNNFHNRIIIGGTNRENSLLDAYVEYANGNSTNDLDPFDTKLAYETYLIDPIPLTLNYFNRAPLYPDGSIAPVDQRKSILSEGYMNEVGFSFGANYSERLYLGATIAIPYIRFHQESTYREINKITDDTNTFKSFTRYEDLTTKGTGFNFKFGLIYRPTDWVRVGAAFHTPSYYGNMRDEWNASMSSKLNNGQNYSWPSPLGNFDYELETPMRGIGSIAFIIGQYGLISADYEYLDYTRAKLRSYDYDFYSENQAIHSKYTSASNIRIGTEWKFGQVSVRAGYAYYGSPYKSGINDALKSTIAAGLGYRDKNFYVDFAYNYTFFAEDYYMYESANVFVQPAKINTKINNFLLTLGIKY
ncbi:MAG: hypothetical protein NT175_07555 [Bacteroidetes bacterium]|nr:hypothetical protein [Bacteroidota bacterium]